MAMRRTPLALAGSVVGLALATLVLVTSASASGGVLDQVRAFARAVDNARSAPGSVVLYVDNVPINSQTIAVQEVAVEQNGFSASDAHQRAIDNAIRGVLIANEGARRGITASNAEIDAFVAAQRTANA